MKSIEEKDYERLVKLISLDARVILNNRELRSEYMYLHSLIEGVEPCVGCGGLSKLQGWINKMTPKTQDEIKLKPQLKQIKMNTFKLKRNHPRVVIPYTSNVITEKSSDELVWYYLNQAKTEEDRKMRESFFEKLPNSIDSEEGKGKSEEGKVEEIKEVKPKAKKRTKK